MIQANCASMPTRAKKGLVLVPDNSVLPGPEPDFSGPFHVSVISTQNLDAITAASPKVSWMFPCKCRGSHGWNRSTCNCDGQDEGSTSRRQRTEFEYRR